MTSNKLEIIADPDKPTIVTRRVVDAPRALVYEMFTKPEHLKRWLGPTTFPMVSCESDVRVGGRWRFVHKMPDGGEIAFSGVFREVEPPGRIVRTFVFEPMPEHEALETLELIEHDGKTTIQTTTVHKTIEGRNGHIADGRMEKGMTEHYAQLDLLLAECGACKPGALDTSVLDLPTFLTTTAQATAVIHLTIPRSEIRNAMGPGRKEIVETLAAQGITPSGPWFSHHFRMNPDTFDFEIGVPVPKPVKPTGRVKNGELPAMKVARTIYRGGYEGLGDAWGQFMTWIAAQGKKPAASLWESYVSDSPMRTELTKPID